MELRLSVAVSKEGKFYVARGIEVELASQGKNIEEVIVNLADPLSGRISASSNDCYFYIEHG